MSDDDFIRIIKRETPYRGHFTLEKFRFRHRRYDGTWSKPLTREVFDRGNAVALLLYDPKRDAVVLAEQFRLPAYVAGKQPLQLETVAGMIDRPGESEEAVARREAEEEAGIAVTGELVPMHRVLLSPGGSTEFVALYCAQVNSRRVGGVFGLASEGEDIKVVVKPFREARRMLRANEIGNATTAVALYWLADNRAKLKRRWLKPKRRP